MGTELQNKRFAEHQLTPLEQELDRWSAQGYRVVSASRRRQEYESGGEPCRHRLGYCEARKQSADYITYVRAQQNDGWELICEEGNWFYFRKPLSAIEAGGSEQLTDDGKGVKLFFGQRLRRLENLRRIELVLTAILLIVGYAVNFWILRAGAIPLILVLIQTYQIKHLDQSLNAWVQS